MALALAALCWLGTRGLGAHTRDERAGWPRDEELVWLPPPQAAPILAMGYRQLWADISWARTLVYFGSNWRDDPSFRYRYLTRFLDNIIALDPKFERVYEWASYAVTFQGGAVEPEEYAMSVRYLEAAMKQFPDRYRYFWLAGIRYYIDLQADDPAEQRRLRERGAALIEQAMLKSDAPANIAELAAGLRTELGQHERALENLRAVILSTDDPETHAKLVKTYQKLAGKEFPDEAAKAKAELQRRWIAELPFVPMHMYLILGDRPAPTVNIESLTAESDVFGTLMAEPDEGAGATPGDEPGATPGGESGATPGAGPGASEAPAGATGAPPGAPETEVQTPAQRGAAATPGAP